MIDRRLKGIHSSARIRVNALISKLSRNSTPPVRRFITAALNPAVSRNCVLGLMPSTEADWLATAQYAGDRLFTPSLYLALQRKKIDVVLDPDILAYFELLLQKNRERNQHLLQQCHRITEQLNEVNILPVPLKGIGVLIRDRYDDPGERMLGDIDLLVRSEQLPEALMCFKRLGFKQIPGPDLLKPLTEQQFSDIAIEQYWNTPDYVRHHVPTLYHLELTVAVDLHCKVQPHNVDPREALTRLAFESGSELRVGRSRFWYPSAEFELMHNFMHSQIINGAAAFGLIDWRHLRDFADTIVKSEDPVSLIARMRQRAANEGYRSRFDFYLWQAKYYLGRFDDIAIEQPNRVRQSFFILLQHNRWLFRLNHGCQEARRLLTHFFNINSLSFQYGPMPKRTALYMRVRRAFSRASLKNYYNRLTDHKH
jgi:hypothetical protein